MMQHLKVIQSKSETSVSKQSFPQISVQILSQLQSDNNLIERQNLLKLFEKVFKVLFIFLKIDKIEVVILSNLVSKLLKVLPLHV